LNPFVCYFLAQVLVCLAACTRRDEWQQGVAAAGPCGLGLIVSAEILFGKLHINLFVFYTIQLNDYPKEIYLVISSLN
jgi:hypothetical protein